MTRSIARLVPFAAVLLGGCGALDTTGTAAPAAHGAHAQMRTDEQALDRAKAAATAFSGQLRGRLQSAMAEGGAIAAVEVCRNDAPRIAHAVMAEHGVRMGRVASPGRQRNSAQGAVDWQLATLTTFQRAVADGAAAGEQVSVVRDGLPDGIALRMMRGIATETGCIACHGSDLAPDIRAAIGRRYPEDGATGFAVGDLRGALWVEVPEVPTGRAGGTP